MLRPPTRALLVKASASASSASASAAGGRQLPSPVLARRPASCPQAVVAAAAPFSSLPRGSLPRDEDEKGSGATIGWPRAPVRGAKTANAKAGGGSGTGTGGRRGGGRKAAGAAAKTSPQTFFKVRVLLLP